MRNGEGCWHFSLVFAANRLEIFTAPGHSNSNVPILSKGVLRMVPVISAAVVIVSVLAFVKVLVLAFDDDQVPCARTAKPNRVLRA